MASNFVCTWDKYEGLFWHFSLAEIQPFYCCCRLKTVNYSSYTLERERFLVLLAMKVLPLLAMA